MSSFSMARRFLLSFFVQFLFRRCYLVARQRDRELCRHGEGTCLCREGVRWRKKTMKEDEENESSGKINDEGLGHVSGTVAGRPPMMR